VALEQEIEAAKRQASGSAVPLTNGKRIAQIAGGFQYAFDIENLLNLPGDSPGDLHVEGHPPLEVSVVSSQGMSIVLSVPQDLGRFVAKASLKTNLTYLLRKLIDRIEALDGSANPVGDRLLGLLPHSGNMVDRDEATPDCELTLNEEQLNAIASSLGKNITYVKGPPGTGKSRTIGQIAAKLHRRDRSVLLVSHTNIAVDQALLNADKAIPASDKADGKVLRIGEPKDKQLDDRPELLIKTHVERRSQELAKKKAELLAEQAGLLPQAQRLSRSVELCEWVQEAVADIDSMASELEELGKLEAALNDSRKTEAELRAQEDEWDRVTKEAAAAQEHTERAVGLGAMITEKEKELAKSQGRIEGAARTLNQAEEVLRESNEMGWLQRKWRGLPSPEEQEVVVAHFRNLLLEHDTKHAVIVNRLRQLREYHQAHTRAVNKFEAKYRKTPAEVMAQAGQYVQTRDNLSHNIKTLEASIGELSEGARATLQSRVSAIKAWGLAEGTPSSLTDMLALIGDAHSRAAQMVQGLDIRQLRGELSLVNTRLEEIERELAGIEESLKQVEELVIADASVIATTLTRAYLRESIQKRRFDTVILDEASMAPIPALWVAASLADHNAVVVGDPKQLPPIVLSDADTAKKWLGRDVFEVAEENRPGTIEDAVALVVQYRMRPEISAIPNELIYGNLQDAPMASDDGELYGWYDEAWAYNEPVLLVDTGPTNAWVTSVASGRRPSRLNFLSATICIDIAHQMLAEGREPPSPGQDKRILVVSPYRPHARLIELTAKEEGLQDEVTSGTAHSFQGSEADVVILDLVNDEPHWRVGLFIPAFDDTTKRLLNVALTRARKRLVVVGDFDYIQRLAKKAFLGKQLVPFLRNRYRSVNALDVVPKGLAARAANAKAAVLGGEVEPSDKRIVVTQQHFFPILFGDLGRASRRVVVYSPFMAPDRVSHMEVHLKACVERGVDVYVVTKPHMDRGKRELAGYQKMEDALTEWGVTIAHKRAMHEKLVFIDDKVLWQGSLNPLSFSNTQEVMERRASREVVADYAKTLCLDDFVGEFEDSPPDCPICGGEIIAAEGRSGGPFYWRCVEDDCYTRSMDQPRLKGGVVRCSNCGGEVEYGEWGGKPHWRCKENRRHRQKVARTHLRLPKMRSLIPKSTLRQLDRRFGISRSVN